VSTGNARGLGAAAVDVVVKNRGLRVPLVPGWSKVLRDALEEAVAAEAKTAA
jgi:hypothetical protein